MWLTNIKYEWCFNYYEIKKGDARQLPLLRFLLLSNSNSGVANSENPTQTKGPLFKVKECF
ncbi:hypothetical protein G4B88_022425 [Cannabis sativa]|uniref:Uncharacterized protein n=1 Tax=Cannabis sativa TaxID=3483 RepID=A0A7J6HVS2_CANSA|nr:hypothetical protein G4B88_022425 [Cannabis sativa]